MSDSDPIVGHKTFRDGLGFRHEPLRQSEADEIMARIDQSKKRREELMPDEAAARKMLFDAWYRLQDFGWRDATYCPKDGSEFEVVEAGSSGVHRCSYEGKWPDGHWWIHADGDLWPSRPVLFRPLAARPQRRTPMNVHDDLRGFCPHCGGTLPDPAFAAPPPVERLLAAADTPPPAGEGGE